VTDLLDRGWRVGNVQRQGLSPRCVRAEYVSPRPQHAVREWSTELCKASADLEKSRPAVIGLRQLHMHKVRREVTGCTT
jgi:hypothetical protein